MKRILLLGTALAAAILIACAPEQESAAETTVAVSPEDTAGFEEFPLGDDHELGPLNVAGVYFQPVDMVPASLGLPASESDIHIEADISAGENELGYGVGDFVPNLTVRYEVAQENGWNSEGTFMPMNASDGPHYGANIKLNGIGDYKIRFLITNPEAQGYVLHVDNTTGVTGRFWDAPLVAEWDFTYPGPSW
ncbi:MAG: iron transporter [Treponema sp.]|nr:iron transporter [Treponema sp.]